MWNCCLKKWRSYVGKRGYDIYVLRTSKSVAAELCPNERVLVGGKDIAIYVPFSPSSPLGHLVLFTPFTSFFSNSRMNRMPHLHLGLILPSRLECLAAPAIGIAPVCVSNSSLVIYDVLYHMYLYTTPLTVASPPWPQLSIIPPMFFSQSACEIVTLPPLLLFTWKL